MSKRGVYVLSMCAWSGLIFLQPAAGADPAGKPGDPAAGATQVRSGVVQEKLKRMYSVRRPVPNAPAVPAAEPVRPSTEVWPERNRLGLQHLDAIRNSQSHLPIGDDIKGAQAPRARRQQTRDAKLVAPTSGYYPIPYYRGSSRLPYSRSSWTNYRYFGGQPGRYGYGAYGLGDDYEGDVYRFGFTQGYDYGRFVSKADERTEKVLAHAGNHLSRGIGYFNDGRYDQASDSFRLAAEADQGDPAARLYAAHACFAIGRYKDAVVYLRQAFELQPKVAYLGYDIRSDYGRQADFDQHLAALEAALKQSPHDYDRLVMLGYVRYFTNQRAQAYAPLRQASQLRPQDPVVTRLLENAKPPDVAAP